ncbi:MAG: dihydropteroate synthase, partial [Gaiellales bacterium]|nr:dihydropteroate synthase [Gaiellales bacterium]
MIADRQPVGWRRATFAGFVLVVLSQVLLVAPLSEFGTAKDPSIAAGLLWAAIALVSVPLMLSVTFELAFANRRREWSLFGVAPPRRIWSSVGIFLMLALIASFIAAILDIAFHISTPSKNDLLGSSTGFQLFWAALTVLFAPWVEETAFRGVLLGALWRRFGFWVAAPLSAVMWAGLHVEWFVLILFTMWGTLLAWLRRRTGSLLPGVALHGTWNAVVVALNQPLWMAAISWAGMAGSVAAAFRRVPEPVSFVDTPETPNSIVPRPPDTELTRRFPPPAVMGVINVTPDSFSDGGDYLDPTAAIAHGLELVEQGAVLIDIGGESTRPGAQQVPADDELARVIPVIEGLVARTQVPISIDTMKAEVARRALDAGASFVNDVSALRHDPEMARVVAAACVPVCLMHMQGTPRTMQNDPRYADVTGEVAAFLLERARFAEAAGVDRELICVDPGIGFGKTMEHNLTLLRELDQIVALGYPVLIAVSRKRFLGQITGRAERQRTAGTIAANLE